MFMHTFSNKAGAMANFWTLRASADLMLSSLRSSAKYAFSEVRNWLTTDSRTAPMAPDVMSHRSDTRRLRNEELDGGVTPGTAAPALLAGSGDDRLPEPAADVVVVVPTLPRLEGGVAIAATVDARCV